MPNLIYWSLFALLFSVAFSQTGGLATISSLDFAVAPVTGTISFLPALNNLVQVVTNISGFAANSVHAIKIIQHGDLSYPFTLADTFQGSGSIRGCPPNSRYAGDLGNFTASPAGAISENRSLDIIELSGSNSVIGRAVVIYDVADNCTGANFTGNPIAIGVIGIPQPSTASSTTPISYATCRLVTTINCRNCSGFVAFSQNSMDVVVTAQVYGIAPPGNGIHVHQWGDISSPDATRAGPHYNPTNATHGLPFRTPRHAGDLGNILSFSGTTGYYQLTLPNMNLATFVGRAVVVHETLDHGAGSSCDQAGNSGKRYAQCVIGIALVDKAPPVPIPLNTTFVDIPCLPITPTNAGSPVATLQPTAGTPSGANGFLRIGFTFIIGFLFIPFLVNL